MDDVAKFKHQRILNAIEAGQWMTTAEIFAAVPRTLLRWPWEANSWVHYLVRKHLVEVERDVHPMLIRKPDAAQFCKAGSA